MNWRCGWIRWPARSPICLTAGTSGNINALPGGQPSLLPCVETISRRSWICWIIGWGAMNCARRPRCLAHAQIKRNGSASPVSIRTRMQSRNRVLKVDQGKIDALMNLIGELVVSKNSLPFLAKRAEQVHGSREMAREIKDLHAVIDRLAQEMQSAIMAVRMLPVSDVFDRFPRLVRDCHAQAGQADRPGDRGRGHRRRQEHDRGTERPASAYRPQRYRSRHRDCRKIATTSASRRGPPFCCGRFRKAIRSSSRWSTTAAASIPKRSSGARCPRASSTKSGRHVLPIRRRSISCSSRLFHRSTRYPTCPGVASAWMWSVNGVRKAGGSVAILRVKDQGTTVRLSLPLSMAVTRVMVVEAAGACCSASRWIRLRNGPRAIATIFDTSSNQSVRAARRHRAALRLDGCWASILWSGSATATRRTRCWWCVPATAWSDLWSISFTKAWTSSLSPSWHPREYSRLFRFRAVGRWTCAAGPQSQGAFVTMPLNFTEDTLTVDGAATVEDALTLLEFLQSHANAKVDLGCLHPPSYRRPPGSPGRPAGDRGAAAGGLPRPLAVARRLGVQRLFAVIAHR